LESEAHETKLDGLFACCNVERERGGQREFAKTFGVVGAREGCY